MKMVMFTPGLETSAIGRMARMVTAALRERGHSVAVVRTEDGELLQRRAHDFGPGVLAWTDEAAVRAAAADADAIVYQVGDNYTFHRGVLEWLPSLPGVVCLHDFFVGNLFNGWAEHRRAEARAVLGSWYGDAAPGGYFGHSSAEEFIAATREHAPMTEWLVAQSLGAVTHSSWGLDRVLQACPGPVRVVPLAYEAPAGWPPPGARGDAGFTVLTVGHVNANKRAESVLRAIAASPRLKAQATFRLVGAIRPEMRERLERLASEAGVRLVVSGEVPDDQLAAALRDADVVCCLRWPTLEAASASTIEAMLCGKAAVVMDTGFYAELPDDCVAKVRPEHEQQDLQRVLERLAADADARRALGERAARWAAGTFTARNYAGELESIALACRRAAPVIEAVQRAALQLKLWDGMHHLMNLPETLEPLKFFDGAASEERSS